MKKPLALSLWVSLVILSVPASRAADNLSMAAVSSDPSTDVSSAIVVLTAEPLSTYARTKPPQGKKIDFSSTSVKSYRAQLNTQRNNFKSWLHDNAPKANVTGTFDIS